MSYWKPSSALLAIKQPSWSHSSSTRQATCRVRPVSPQGLQVAPTALTLRTSTTRYRTRTHPMVPAKHRRAAPIARNTWHATRCWRPEPTAPARSARRKRSRCHAPAGAAQLGGIQRQGVPVLKETHPPAPTQSKPLPNSLTTAPGKQRVRVHGKRRHRRSSSSERSDTSSSISSSPSSSSSLSPDSDARRKKRKSKRHKRHKRHSMSLDSSFLNAPFTTMVPTPSRREVRRIKRGKYPRKKSCMFHACKILHEMHDAS